MGRLSILILLVAFVKDTFSKPQWNKYNGYNNPYYYNQRTAQTNPYTNQRSYINHAPNPKPHAHPHPVQITATPSARDLKPLIKSMKTIVPILVRGYVVPEQESVSEKRNYVDSPVLKNNPVFDNIMKHWMQAHPGIVKIIKGQELAKRAKINRYRDPALDKVPFFNPYQMFPRGNIARPDMQTDGCPNYVRTPGQYKFILGRAFDATIPAKRKYMKAVKGTTKHIDEIFSGRCWDYQKKKKLTPEIDCNALWSAFVKSFTYKGPCDVTYDDYKPFFDMIKEPPVINKVLLWSGVKDLVHSYARFNDKFTTVEDTFAGYLMSGLTWCGSKNSPGIDFNSCPYECAKQKPYWGQVAEKLAHRAKGTVSILVNGTRQHFVDKQIFPAFMLDSYLAQNQLPNLSPTQVSELRILVGHTNKHKILENCSTCSIKALRKAAMNFGIRTTCQDDPGMIRHLLCTDEPNEPLCRFAHLIISG